MGIVVPLLFEPRSIKTSGNSKARGQQGHGTHHMGFHLTCPEGRFPAPWLLQSYCAQAHCKASPTQGWEAEGERRWSVSRNPKVGAR